MSRCYANFASANTAFKGSSNSYFYRCFAVLSSNTGTGFGLDSGAVAVGCISQGGNDGFDMSTSTGIVTACVAYGAARYGFSCSGSSSNVLLVNCIAYGSGSYGYTLSAGYDTTVLMNCAGGNNTSGNFNPTQSPFFQNFLVLTANPFVNAGSGDFSLNNLPTGGGLLRGVAYPNSMPGGTTSNYADVGAVQHQEASASRGPSIGSQRIKPARRSA